MTTIEICSPHPPLSLTNTPHNHQRCLSLLTQYTGIRSIPPIRQIHAHALRASLDQPKLWNTLIRAYTSAGAAQYALLVFPQMPLKDNFTFPFIFKACSLLSSIQFGICIHTHLLKLGFGSDVYSLNSLLYLYSKCGFLKEARQLFDEIPQRSVSSWSAMIAGYDLNACHREALRIFLEMRAENVLADEMTLVSVISVCTKCGYLKFGESVHAYGIVNGLRLDFVGFATALVDMYAKCGSISVSQKVFDKMLERNVMSWSAMIGGFAMHGLGKEALGIFAEMIDAEVEPTSVTFTNVLAACSHIGLVDEGQHFFQSMRDIYSIEPRIEHHGCMVDLFGRADLLEQAHDFIKNMSIEPTGALWRSLLGSACTHGNLEMGKLAMDRLARLDDLTAGDYVMLANLYARFGRWNDVGKVRTLMNDLGVRKTPGYSVIEVNGVIHKFVMGDKSHPQSQLIYEMLDEVVEMSRYWFS